jgi:hypothetical protein
MILSILQELQAKNEQLLDRNCVCGIAVPARSVCGSGTCLRASHPAQRGGWEAAYEAHGIADDGNFDAEAVRPGRS